MRFSKDYHHKSDFFSRKRILSQRQALFFILEEVFLLALIIIQSYRMLGIALVNKSIYFFYYSPELQNIIWFLASIAFFCMGYLIIVLRDTSVHNIHKNFSKILFETIKQKVFETPREVIMFVFAEIVFALVVAISIFLYLDPEINLVPFPLNIVGFAFFLGISLLFFSHTKSFREMVYGPTYLQRKLHEGNYEVKRTTLAKTGHIRVAQKKPYKKHKLSK